MIFNRLLTTIKSLFFINRNLFYLNSRIDQLYKKIKHLEASNSANLKRLPLNLSENIDNKDLNVLIEAMENNIASLQYSIANLMSKNSHSDLNDIGFNSQNFRKKIFIELINECAIECILETGTFLGDTTYWISQNSNSEIYTTELNPVFYGISKARFSGNDNIYIYNLDSREFLNSLSENTDIFQKKLFIYLDSHWYQDLPLFEELDFISLNINEFVVMVDDFRVPYDQGYGYDNYGNGNCLELEYLKDLIKKYKLACYFPSLHSSEETGAKRGCVVITRNTDIERVITSKVQSLKKYYNAS